MKLTMTVERPQGERRKTSQLLKTFRAPQSSGCGRGLGGGVALSQQVACK